MTEVSLDGAGIDALVGQLVAARVPEHVRMELHIEARRAAGALDHPLKATGGERCTALADKQERRAASDGALRAQCFRIKFGMPRIDISLQVFISQ